MINRPSFEDFEACPRTQTSDPSAPPGSSKNDEVETVAAEHRTAKIREANDKFRTTLSGGDVFCTSGIVGLGTFAQLEILDRVRAFNAFNKENDPYEERDFGSFKYDSKLVFWKIDYYDQDLQGGSPDAANTDVTRRVLTVMLASEY